MDFRSRVLLSGSVIIAALAIIFILQTKDLGKLRLIFCNVGQGDGILLISPSGKQILVDGGPGSKILDCLSEKMPFWDKIVEMVVLTHPQKDHLEGLVAVLERYRVENIVTTGVKNETELFEVWNQAIKSEKAKVHLAKKGDQIVIDGRGPTPNLEILWPSSAKASEWQANPPTDLNETSIALRLDYSSSTSSAPFGARASSGFCAYLTGDIPKEILENLIDRQCQILKISHHGSKTGTNERILEVVKPQIAIIQVGKNSFGHPHKEVINLLASKGIQVLRNDRDGEIELRVENGKLTIVN